MENGFCNVFLLAFRVQKNATTASVISDAAATLGLDPGGLYVLAEVKESGGEEWILEAGDLPVQRVLLWPRKAQEQHPQSAGFYFLLQVKLTTLSSSCCQPCQIQSSKRNAATVCCMVLPSAFFHFVVTSRQT